MSKAKAAYKSESENELDYFKVEIIQLILWFRFVCSLSLGHLVLFKALAKADAMSMLIPSPSAERFLSPTNFMRPHPPPQEDKRVAFMDLDFTVMTSHEFISYTGPCRGQVGLIWFRFLDFLRPVLRVLWYSLTFIWTTRICGELHQNDRFFGGGVIHNPCHWRFICLSWDSCRTWGACWGSL